MLQPSTLSQPLTADRSMPVVEHPAHPCLNCHTPLAADYCATCGQKATTHRYSFGHFLAHDVVHGIWHVDNGLLPTIKALFVRPGHRVREYLAGRRVGFFNFFTLLLLTLAAGHFLEGFTHVKLSDLVSENSRAAIGAVEAFFEKYPKASLVLTVPVYALFSFVWFRKSGFNLTEHFVLNAYKTAGESVIALVFSALTIFYTNVPVLSKLYGLVSLLSMVYTVVFYCQFFAQAGYRKKSLVLRSCAVPLTYSFFYALLGVIWKIATHT